MGLQLKHSGFFAALPRLLAAVAAALTDTQHDPAWRDVPQQLGVDPASVPAAVRQLLFLQDFSTWLLLLTKDSLCFFPLQLDRAAVAVPALRLCAAVMQLCSRCADQIPAGAAPPPTSQEQLMFAAFTAGQEVCAAWDLGEEDFDPNLSSSADAVCAIAMLLLVPTVCPEDFYQDTPQIPDSSAARSKKAKTRLTIRANTSLASWQFACAHEAELPAVQQAALQELGCSGRALMYAAGHVLTPVINSHVVMKLCQALLCVAKHSVTYTEALRARLDGLSHAQQLALAETLSSSNRDDPPSSSPLLPCAPLFWLLPTVLLTWADKQPCSGPDITLQQYALMTLLHVAVSGVLEQQSYWTAADQAMFEAGGGAEGAFEEQQAMARALYAMLHGGAAMAPVIPARMQGLSLQEVARANLERGLFKNAGKKAVSFSSDCAPPASCLAQLLQLASNAAARMLAIIQGATPGGSPSHHDGSSSSTGPSTGSGSRGTSSGSGSFLSEAEHLDRAKFSLANTLPPLLKLSEGWLWGVFCKDSSAGRYDALKGLEAMGIVGPPQRVVPGRGRSSQGSDCDSDEDRSSCCDEQKGMAALCAALQETMPQLTELVEAALRRGVGREAYGYLAATGGGFLRILTADPVFVAAGVGQPGSPALRPLSSLAFTLLKLVNAIHTKPDAQSRDATIASGTRCLEANLQANSLILRAACDNSSASSTGSHRRRRSSSSSSSAAAVINMLACSSGRKPGRLSEEHLLAISNSTG